MEVEFTISKSAINFLVSHLVASFSRSALEDLNASKSLEHRGSNWTLFSWTFYVQWLSLLGRKAKIKV